MTNRRNPALLLLVAGSLLLAGCASSPSDQTPDDQTHPAGMHAGMIMPNGSTMGALAPTTVTTADKPSPAEKMICSAETHATIARIIGLPNAPTSTATWRDHLYTCTYQLPIGTLIVSVKRSSDPATAAAYFHRLRTNLHPATTLAGLGERSYGTSAGTVVLIKDSDTLTVDATRLPSVFGDEQSKRFDFAYQLASDILGCWIEG